MAQEPYGGTPQKIPGRIETEDFDEGGEGVAYSESDPKRSWAIDYRPEPVDFKSSPDSDDDVSIGAFSADEWLEYTVDVLPGTYDIILRGTTNRDGRGMQLLLGGEEIAVIDVPNQGTWMEYFNFSVSGISIEGKKEQRILRISPTADGVDVGWIDFVRTGRAPDSNLIKITNDGSGDTEYIFETDGTYLEKNPNEGSIQDSDVVTGLRADGLVNGGTDAYDYDGWISTFAYTGVTPQVTINGTQVDPASIGIPHTEDFVFSQGEVQFREGEVQFREEKEETEGFGYGEETYGFNGYGGTSA